MRESVLALGASLGLLWSAKALETRSGTREVISKQSANNQQRNQKISKAPRWCGRRGVRPAACRDVMALAPQSDIDSVAAVYGIDPSELPFGR